MNPTLHTTPVFRWLVNLSDEQIPNSHSRPLVDIRERQLRRLSGMQFSRQGGFINCHIGKNLSLKQSIPLKKF
jgi:hypothetical protein